MSQKPQSTIEPKAIQKLAKLIQNSNHTVFFGGAGVSTESGVPDFRSAKGIYQVERHAEEILTPRFMKQQPENYYDFYRKYFMLEGIKPNACHLALAELEKRKLLDAVITQNVDNLHQDAGSQNVIELHGNGSRFYCPKCQKQYSIVDVRKTTDVPYCDCGGLIRADIVHYEENLPEKALQAAIYAIEHTELLIIGGTSLSVYPAAGLIRYQPRFGKKVLIDFAAELQGAVDLVIRAPIGKVFDALMQELDAPSNLPTNAPTNPPSDTPKT